MPFAGEIGRVTILLEELGYRRRGLCQPVGVARSDDYREGRADGIAAGHEGRAPRRATRLAVPAGEPGAFGGDTVNVWGRMAKALAAPVASEVIPAGVIRHEHDDV